VCRRAIVCYASEDLAVAVAVAGVAEVERVLPSRYRDPA
jgi:hypothetical protein